MQDFENTSSRAASRQSERNSTADRRRARTQQNAGSRKRAVDRSGRPIKRRRRKKKRQSLALWLICIIFLVLLAIAGIFVLKRYSPSDERADLNAYYGIENDNQLAVILDHEAMEAPMGIVADGKAYLQFDFVHDYLNERFYWDAGENQLLYTLPRDVVSVGVGSTEYSISKDKNSVDYVILRTEGSTAYVAMDFIKQYTDIAYEVFDNPHRVVITSKWDSDQVSVVKADTQVRKLGGVKSPILTDIKRKDEVVILDREENWTKVCTADGFIGYVKKSTLKKDKTVKPESTFEAPEYTSIKVDGTVNMVWHNVTNRQANDTVFKRLAKTKGVNVVCPSWYHVKSVDGALESVSSAEYVNYAHQNNVKVWATVRDFDGGINSAEESTAFLSSTKARSNLINKLVADAISVQLDGINVDFEKIAIDAGAHYIQFIRELSVKCRMNELVLSVDNYVPLSINEQYNRKEQGVFADYVVIMGYDEHWGGCPEAGSVDSYEYVKYGIEKTLEEVPAEKVVIGLPFFTRLWKETPKTQEQLAQEAGTDAAQYATNVESQTMTMSEGRKAVSGAGAKATWDDTIKQNYATWTAEDGTYKIWLEDEQSLEVRLQLMKEKNIAGVGFWALGQEPADIWNLIQKYVN